MLVLLEVDPNKYHHINSAMREKKKEREMITSNHGRLHKGGNILGRSVRIFEYQYFRMGMRLTHKNAEALKEG